MSDSILVLNAGSSSIKFSVQTPTGADTVRTLAVGQIEGIRNHTHFIAKGADGAVLAETRWPDGTGPADHGAALHVISEWLDGFLVLLCHRLLRNAIFPKKINRLATCAQKY